MRGLSENVFFCWDLFSCFIDAFMWYRGIQEKKYTPEEIININSWYDEKYVEECLKMWKQESQMYRHESKRQRGFIHFLSNSNKWLATWLFYTSSFFQLPISTTIRILKNEFPVTRSSYIFILLNILRIALWFQPIDDDNRLVVTRAI